MRILNYGAGAVGLGIDSCLLASGCQVDIIARPKTVSGLQRNGLKRTGIFGDALIPPQNINVFSSIGEGLPGLYDIILVTTKSFDSRVAAEDIARHKSLWGPETIFILAQNGWGNTEIFSQHFLPQQIYNARVITGFSRPQPHEVIVTVHADAIHIGSLFGADLSKVLPFCQAINSGGIPCTTSPDISRDLWAKMLYNCALNPLGAILGVTYGKLGAQKESRLIMEKIIEEIYDVMAASGFKTHWDCAEDYENIFFKQLIPATAEHKSSTLQSLQSKKRTEVDALNGTIVAMGRKTSIPVPTNACLYRMVKFIENQYESA